MAKKKSANRGRTPKTVLRLPDLDQANPARIWVKVAVDCWTTAAEVTDGRIFRCVNRTGAVWGDGITEKVIWCAVKGLHQRHTSGISRLMICLGPALVLSSRPRRTRSDSFHPWARQRSDYWAIIPIPIGRSLPMGMGMIAQ